VRFTAEGVGTAGPLPDEAGQHLEQILREALTNTARHAGSCRVMVSLVFAPDELDLIVSDDGCGPGTQDATTTTRTHQGLRNMSERARRLGGRLAVEEALGGGTRVTLEVPLDSDEPEGEMFLTDPEREVTHS
jgi:signal transduction histidine kinase